MVINALICDDDQKCVDQISEYLDHYCYDHSLSYSVKSFTDGMQAIRSEAVYNIAFLDIEIGNVSGLDIAKALKEKNKNSNHSNTKTFNCTDYHYINYISFRLLYNRHTIFRR